MCPCSKSLKLPHYLEHQDHSSQPDILDSACGLTLGKLSILNSFNASRHTLRLAVLSYVNPQLGRAIFMLPCVDLFMHQKMSISSSPILSTWEADSYFLRLRSSIWSSLKWSLIHFVCCHRSVSNLLFPGPCECLPKLPRLFTVPQLSSVLLSVLAPFTLCYIQTFGTGWA